VNISSPGLLAGRWFWSGLIGDAVMVALLDGFDRWVAAGVSGLIEEVCMAFQSMISDH
jgi:hypothetical protein